MDINPDDIGEYKLEQITDKDLGDMYLVYGRALVTRSSSSVLFFKR